MQKIPLALAGLIVSVNMVTAQDIAPSLIDHWATLEQCQAAPSDAPLYRPTPKPGCNLDRKDVVRRGVATPACVLLDVPDRLAAPGNDGYSWTRSGPGQDFFFRLNGEVDSLAECCNDVKRIVPLHTTPQLVAAPPTPPATPASPQSDKRVSGKVEHEVSGTVEHNVHFDPLKIVADPNLLTTTSNSTTNHRSRSIWKNPWTYVGIAGAAVLAKCTFWGPCIRMVNENNVPTRRDAW